MGNQNATGIVGEDKAEKEVQQEGNHVIPEGVKNDDLTEENHAISDHEQRDFLENAADCNGRATESNGAEPSGFPNVSEEENGIASEDIDAQANTLLESHDQLSLSKDDANVPDEPQEENGNLLSEESDQTQEVSAPCNFEELHLIEANVIQSLNAEKKTEEFEGNEKVSLEDELSDTSGQEEKSESQNDGLVLAEEMIPMVSNANEAEFGGKETDQSESPVADQTETRTESVIRESKEENAIGITSNSSPEKVDHIEEAMLTQSDLSLLEECIATSNKNGEEEETGESTLSSIQTSSSNDTEAMLTQSELIPLQECIASRKENGERKAMGESIPEKAVEYETDNREGVANEQKYDVQEQLFPECFTEIRTRNSLDNSINQETELAESIQGNYITSKESEIPSAGGLGNSLEMRKSPSFDFGVSFDARSEESDQTPLLYQDKTAIRSLSSCATLVRSSLQYNNQEPGLEEKTIRPIERGNSENSRAPIMNMIKNEAKANAEEKQENNAVGNKEDKDFQVSESKEIVLNSSKGKGKRRTRSSLFSTCICCSAAIS